MSPLPSQLELVAQDRGVLGTGSVEKLTSWPLPGTSEEVHPTGATAELEEWEEWPPRVDSILLMEAEAAMRDMAGPEWLAWRGSRDSPRRGSPPASHRIRGNEPAPGLDAVGFDDRELRGLDPVGRDILEEELAEIDREMVTVVLPSAPGPPFDNLATRDSCHVSH